MPSAALGCAIVVSGRYLVVMAKICSSLMLATCSTQCMEGTLPLSSGWMGRARTAWLPSPHSLASRGRIPLETASRTSGGWYLTLRAKMVTSSSLCQAPVERKGTPQWNRVRQ